MSIKENEANEMGELVARALDDGMRRLMSGEDDAFASAISIAEESHGALRAVIGLMIDRDAEPGSGAKIQGIRRNDLAELLKLVNRRLGDAVSQARDTKTERRVEAQRAESTTRAVRGAKKDRREPVRLVAAPLRAQEQ